ncbi:hypothetical protein QBC34DRAFT_474512 [Podospora aff. communis PSN243]|uniref:Uncharacterized protein n=1 Tax=Podospora aff. communis PSN243 TaxID=3040156 RepID=A0AAV9GB79_9PEZI|nr:hypothetical protein QBC34DRAFT_474512 [Podospora aff. communis PSN243]
MDRSPLPRLTEATLEFQFLVPQGDVDYHPTDKRWFAHTPYQPPLSQGNTHIEPHPAVFSHLKTIFNAIPLKLKTPSTHHCETRLWGLDIPTSTWSVTLCPSAHSEHAGKPSQVLAERYNLAGIQLSSQPYTASDLDYQDVEKVCVALRREMRLQISETCSLRVHVSAVGKEGLDEMAVRKGVMLLWVVERLLFGVCAPGRGEKGGCGMVTGASRLRTAGEFPQTAISERLEGLVPVDVGLDEETLRVLQVICRAELLSELDTLLRGSDSDEFKRLSIEICPLGGKEGIRFHLHEGTLDPAMAKLWARVCMAVVQNAMMDDDKFRELFRRIIQHKSADVAYDWAELLIDLGLPTSDIDAFRKKHMVLQRSTRASEGASSPFLPTVKEDKLRIASAEPVTPGWLLWADGIPWTSMFGSE